MSRVGNSPIKVPEGVFIDIQPSKINIKGKLGAHHLKWNCQV